jgi:hypothetical protein
MVLLLTEMVQFSGFIRQTLSRITVDSHKSIAIKTRTFSFIDRQEEHVVKVANLQLLCF